MVRRYLSGESTYRLAAAYGFSSGIVCYHLDKLGVIRDRCRWVHRLSEAELLTIAQRHQDGETQQQISRDMGIPQTTVSRIVRKRETERVDHQHRIYTCNHHFFSRIDTEEKAYWLGFLAADGCISNQQTVQILLAERDTDRLLAFRQSLESNHRITRRERKHPAVFMRIKSAQLCRDLGALGLTPRKTDTHPFIQLPEGLQHHYIRGYVDGDGGFYHYPPNNYRFMVVSNLCFIQRLQDYLMQTCGLNRTALDHGPRVVRLTYTGRRQVLTIARHLYRGACIYMERKRRLAFVGEARDLT